MVASLSGGSPVAVLGAGAGGLATAADLSLAGRRVQLYELPEFRSTFDAIERQAGIDCVGVGRTGRVMPALATTDPREALRGAELVLVNAPAFGHQRLVEAVAPHLEDGQLVLFSTGYWAALRFGDALARRGATVAESTLLVYAVRRTGPASVAIDGIKGDLPVAALPYSETPRLLQLLGPIYPQARAMRSVLEVSLENLNPLFHPAIALANAAALERATEEFAFYSEGCTPAVGRIIDALDAERLAVGRALGLDLVTAAGWLQRYYGATGETAYAAIVSCPAYRDFRWPTKTAIRYVDEDVPFALVPLAAIARRLGIAAPATEALIDVCGLAFGHEYRREAPASVPLLAALERVAPVALL